MWKIGAVLVAFAVVGAACAGGGGGGDDDDIGDDDDDGTTGCPRTLAEADRVRYGAIGLPYTAAGDPANAWEIVALGTTGGVSFGVASFEMGRQPFGEVVFTPDGEVGLVAQDDGTLGVFTVDAQGGVTVVHAGFEGSFYASRVVMDPSGERAWILDVNFPKNGGGIYGVTIGCDGSLTDDGLLVETKLAYDMEIRTPGAAVVYAKSLADSPFANDLHKVALDPIGQTSGVDAFPTDDDAIVADLAITDDRNFALIADNNSFGTGDRVSVVDLVPTSPVHVQTLAIGDPVSIAVSPFDDAVVVANGFGNAVFVVPYDGSVVPPFGTPVELAYVGAAPELPANFVPMTRGELEGDVYLAELSGIRRIRFLGDGQVVDLGLVSRGGGVENIVGAFGFPP